MQDFFYMDLCAEMHRICYLALPFFHVEAVACETLEPCLRLGMKSLENLELQVKPVLGSVMSIPA